MIPQSAKGPLDGATVVTIVVAWLQYLSQGLTILATTAALIYTCIRISETKRFRQFIDWLRSRKD